MGQPKDVVTWQPAAPGIWRVTMASPPANALSVPLLDGLHAALNAAEAAGDVKVIVLSSAVDGFFAAGAAVFLGSAYYFLVHRLSRRPA